MKKNLCKKIKLIAADWKLGDFFRNLLAVILGIIITFIGSDIITERNAQKELKQAMQLVKSELLINSEGVKAIGDRVTIEQRGAKFLLEYKDKMKEAPKDSIDKYALLPFETSYFSFTNDALEMLKASGLVQKIENKELALQVIGAYSAVKEAEVLFQFFVEAKAESHNILYTNPATKKISVSPSNLAEAWEEFLKLPEGVSFLNQIMAIHPPSVYYNCMKAIDETIAGIEKEFK